MKKTLSLLAVFAVAGMMSTPAQAADHYISGMAGISWFQDSDVNRVYQPTTTVPGVAEFDSGLTAVGAIGCDYGSTRLEAEIGYQKNDFNDSDTGKAYVLSLMANGFYDIDLGGVDLYAMAGVGVAQVNIQYDDSETSGFGNNAVSVPYTYEVTETTLAYQLGAGLAIPVGDGVMIDARYRYFATTDFVTGDDRDSSGFLMLNPGINKTNISSHSAMLGLRVNL